MSGLTAVFKRELLSLWVTPLAWVLLVTFLLLQGAIFYSITVHLSHMDQATLEAGPIQAYFGQQSLLMALTLLLLCPGLTMRTFAEERRSGTVESLLSAPVGSGSIVLGKYAGVLCTYAFIWLPTLLYVILLRGTGTIFAATIVVNYFGVLLLGASYLAIGVFMSCLAKSQLMALLLTSATLFSFFVMGMGQYVFDSGLMTALSAYLSPVTMLEETAKGVIDSRRVILHSSLIAWCLFVSSRVIESWRNG